MTTDEHRNQVNKNAVRIRGIAWVLLILLPLSALGSRFGLWPHTIGLLLLMLSIFGSLLIQIVNAIWLLRKPNLATKSALRWACLFALPPLVIAATVIRGASDSDSSERIAIHNISTDINNPPRFSAAKEQRGTDSNPLEYSSQTASNQQKLYPDLSPIDSSLSTSQAFATALTISRELGWKVYAEDINSGHIEAVDSTFWFGFKDDIVIRIQASNSGSVIDLRSVSRVGQGDMGANNQRIRAFIDLFNQQTQ